MFPNHGRFIRYMESDFFKENLREIDHYLVQWMKRRFLIHEAEIK
jgi:hypothetical protein